MIASQPRIAMLSVHSCPVGNLGARDTGGMNVYIRELVSELGKQGHVVDIYTRVHDPRDPQIVDLGPRARLIHLRAGEHTEINKRALYHYLPEFADNLEDFRKQDGREYDLVFSHYWLSGWLGELLQQRWHVPHITMFHTLGAVKNTFGIGETEPELRIETERGLAQNCHGIIASTEQEKEELALFYGASPDRISVIPCGVNLELFQPIARDAARLKLGFSDEKIVLFVGRIEPLKGIEQLLKALPHLPDTRGLRLVIVGGDEHSQDEIKRLKELSRSLRIAPSVTFLGLTKQDKLPYFYSAADVCVVPSYYESFGLVTLESLACGTPVIATDVGALRNIIQPGKTGYVVANNNPRNLAEKLSLLLAEPAEMKSPLAIRATVSRYVWPNIAEAVTETCRAILESVAPVP